MSSTVGFALLALGVVLLLLGLIAAASARASLLASRPFQAVLILAGLALMVWIVFWQRPWMAAPVEVTTTVEQSAIGPPAAPVVKPTVSRQQLFASANGAFDNCLRPTAPTSLPDGASANVDTMKITREAVQDFDHRSTTYTKCLDSAYDQVKLQFQNKAADSDLLDLNEVVLRLHNAAVDSDQDVADRFNAQLRIYKAKHPGKTPAS